MPRRMEKIREAGVNELAAQQKELTETIFRLRFQLSTGQAEALKRLRESKKDLARVKTLLRAHELNAASQSESTAAQAQVAAPAAAKTRKAAAAPRSKKSNKAKA
jgi:large subunit ribosomal protein L29